MEIVKGWKMVKEDMTCRNHKFEIGKWYKIEGDIKMCKNGFHFHEKSSDVFNYYSSKDRLFECEAIEVEAGDDKSVCRKIRLTEELGNILKINFGGSGSGSGDGSGYGYGSGSGYGYGYGYGSGSGDGSGDGYGSGSGDGYGYGDGSGYGYGYGYGDGSGDGSGSGSGYGYGDGYGDGLDKHIFQRSFLRCI